MWRVASICALALLASGCQGSRWARDDVDYARKYPHHTDNVLKTTKQAVDARHVIGKRGVYAGFAGRDEPFGAGAEAGVFAYPRSWLEARAGGAVLAHEGDHPISGGGLLGVRVQPPSRIAPFVGVAGYIGWAEVESITIALNPGPGEPTVDIDQALVLGVAPEIGAHVWLTPQWRLTGSVDYRFMSDSRDPDSLFYGVNIAWLPPGQSGPRHAKRDTGDWSFEGRPAKTLPPEPVEIPMAESSVEPAIRLEDALESAAPDAGVQPANAYDALEI